MTDMTKLKKQALLVGIAREMGFEDAEEAWWCNNFPVSDINDVAESGGVGEVYGVDIGIFLLATVYTVSRWSDGCCGSEGGEVEYGHFDTAGEAKAWASVKRIMEER